MPVAPRHRHRRRPHRRVRARRVLRARGRRPGRHPEDLLRPRADGDRRAVRLHRRRDLRPSSTCARATAIWDLRSYVAIHLSLDPRRRRAASPGSIWAKGSWGPWWVWDEPMLVSFLIVFLLYATYQPLRFSIEDPERQARYASVFAIVGGRVRAAELRRRADGRVVPAPAHARHDDRRDARRDDADVPRRARRDGAAVRDAVEATRWRPSMTRGRVRALRRRLAGDDAAVVRPAAAPRRR